MYQNVVELADVDVQNEAAGTGQHVTAVQVTPFIPSGRLAEIMISPVVHAATAIPIILAHALAPLPVVLTAAVAMALIVTVSMALIAAVAVALIVTVPMALIASVSLVVTLGLLLLAVRVIVVVLRCNRKRP